MKNGMMTFFFFQKISWTSKKARDFKKASKEDVRNRQQRNPPKGEKDECHLQEMQEYNYF